jgi:hypothetical protein
VSALLFGERWSAHVERDVNACLGHGTQHDVEALGRRVATEREESETLAVADGSAREL